MQFTLKMFLPVVLSCVSLSLFAEGDVTDKSTGESFPQEVAFSYEGKDYTLEATGVATRKKLIVKVYSVAAYLQKGVAGKKGDIFANYLSDQYARQLTMKFVREVPLDKVQEGYKDSFKKSVSPSLYSSLESTLSEYLGFFTNDMKKGDEVVIRALPGGFIEVIINGDEAGSLNNEAFAKGLFSIWFGPNSIVNKNDLVSLAK